MHERIVDLLVFLMGELRTHDQFDKINVSGLSRQGYSQVEISTAFAWLFDNIQTQRAQRRGVGTQKSVRILHEAEETVLKPEGYGYLLQCYHLGLLSTEDVEAVIERIMLDGGSFAGAEEVRSVIAALLFEHDRPAEGGYPLLGPTDSIH